VGLKKSPQKKATRRKQKPKEIIRYLQIRIMKRTEDCLASPQNKNKNKEENKNKRK
jgi:hypothetical protein